MFWDVALGVQECTGHLAGTQLAKKIEPNEDLGLQGTLGENHPHSQDLRALSCFSRIKEDLLWHRKGDGLEPKKVWFKLGARRDFL